jgi:hypothetical protein
MKALGYWLLAFAVVAGLPITAAQAQPFARTWVSAATGSDDNACTRTSPCATWAGALAKTLPYGEIDALDPGGYGAVTITQSVSLYNEGVGEAGITVTGASAIVIDAPQGTVNLRGLTLNGSDNAENGVLIQSASEVNIENCVIQGFTSSGQLAGVYVNPTTILGTASVAIGGSSIRGNNAGVIIKPGSQAYAYVTIDHSRITSNIGAGVRIDGSGGGNIYATVTDTNVSLNGANGVYAVSDNSNVLVSLMRDVFSINNEYGVEASGIHTIVTIGESVMLSNQAGALDAVASASLWSHQTNQVVLSSGGTGFTANIGQQ